MEEVSREMKKKEKRMKWKKLSWWKESKTERAVVFRWSGRMEVGATARKVKAAQTAGTPSETQTSRLSFPRRTI